jgi:hypothetical protein
MTHSMMKTPMAVLKKEAQISLAKHNLHADGKGGIKVRLVLDHSGSMHRWYEHGAVQRLTEQVLGLAAALDDDGTIEVWYFGSGVSEMFKVSLHPTVAVKTPGVPANDELDPYYVGWVNRSHKRIPWGSTNYPAGLKAPVDFQRATGEAEPSLVIFQTDGGPDDRVAANSMLRMLSSDNTFFSFVVFGEKGTEEHPTDVGEYMDSLDNLTGRVRDNASAFFTGGLNNYATLPDSEVYDGVLGEFVGQWLPQVL